MHSPLGAPNVDNSLCRVVGAEPYKTLHSGREVLWFQVLLYSLEPRYTRTSWWFSPVVRGRGRQHPRSIRLVRHSWKLSGQLEKTIASSSARWNRRNTNQYFCVIALPTPILFVGGVAPWFGRRSLAGGLSLSCARYVADRWQTVWYGSANSAFHPVGVGKWVVIHVFTWINEGETIKKAE